MAGTPPKVFVERQASYDKRGGVSREKDEGGRMKDEVKGEK
jgi:hypothetical protein